MKNNITNRRYNILADFTKVYDFLVKTYDFKTLNSYLLPQYFEYAQHLQWFDYLHSHCIGLWEEDGGIVAISAYEMELGSAHVHTRVGYEFLLPELLEWAENEIASIKNGERSLGVWIVDNELEKTKLLQERGYHLDTYTQAVTIFDYQKPFLPRELPAGFTMIDGNDVDYEKLATCFSKGFDNTDVLEEPVSDKDIAGNFKRFNSPHADLSLMRVVVAPDGEYASALGMWYDEVNKYAYLEPMATVPKYRRMGLGTASLMDAMAKTKELGATYCFGGPVMEFYPKVGFEMVAERHLWKKVF